MLSSLAVATDYWRHYIPVAPDIDITVVIGEDHFIDLRPYIMQGARDFFTQNSPDPLVIPDRVPSQRGWRLDYMAVTSPRKGEVKQDVFKNGFIYTPDRSAGNATDCFNYQFSNGTQLSNYGKINVTIIKSYEATWEITAFNRLANTGVSPAEFAMKMVMQSTHPSFTIGTVHGYVWYVEKVYVANGYVKKDLELIKQFRTYTSPSSYESSIVDKADTIPRRTYQNDSLIVGLDPRTNRRYIPTNKFPDVFCEFWNYPHKRRQYESGSSTGAYHLVTDMSRPEVYKFKIQDFHTNVWNMSGKIKLPPPPPTPTNPTP